MPTKKKMDQVEELRDRLERSTIVVATDHTGLSVNLMTDLRRQMRTREVEYRVVKNTLTYLAADAAESPAIREIVQGPTALAFGYGEPQLVAKALEEYIRVNRSLLTIKGAVLEGRTLTAAQVNTLATLPPKEQLVAQLLGQVQLPLAQLSGQLRAPLSRLLSSLNGPLAAFTMALQQRAAQLESQQASG